MGKNLKKIVLAVVLSFSCVYGMDDFDMGVNYSLVGVEIGYGSISSEMTNANTSPVTFNTDDTQIGHIGLKIGAESLNYRLLLSGRYEKDTDSNFDYIMDYEMEGDYLFNFSRSANFFIGVHGGMTYMKFIVAGEPFSRTISNHYYGGNLGFNIHANKSTDIEIGSRMMIMDASNIKNGVEYKFTDSLSAYCSVIFKYKMD
jgi:hypothetical protein